MKQIEMPIEAKIMLKDFCDVLDVTPEDVLSKSKKRELVDARHIAMSFFKQKFKGAFSLVTIGKWFDKTHCSVITSSRKVESLMSVNNEFREKCLKCQGAIFELSIYNHIPQY